MVCGFDLLDFLVSYGKLPLISIFFFQTQNLFFFSFLVCFSLSPHGPGYPPPKQYSSPLGIFPYGPRSSQLKDARKLGVPLTRKVHPCGTVQTELNPEFSPTPRAIPPAHFFPPLGCPSMTPDLRHLKARASLTRNGTPWERYKPKLKHVVHGPHAWLPLVSDEHSARFPRAKLL